MARVDDDGADEFDADDPTRAREIVRWPRDRAWRWVVIGALLAGAGVVAAPTHSTTDGLGLVSTLALPPTLAWDVATPVGSEPGGRLDAEVVGDVIVVTTDAAVAGYTLARGALLWEVSIERGRCTYQEEVVCVSGHDTDAVVTTIDPPTGEVDVLALPDAAWALRVDGEVVALRYAERVQSVVRLGADGVAQWSTEVPYQPGIGGAATGYPFARIGDRLYVGTAGPAVLDLDDGATLARPLVLRYDRSGIFGLGFNETWWHLWTGEQVALHEGAARLAVDDDVDGVPVLVSAATGITQVFQEPGSQLVWSGAGGETPIARLAGVLVTDDDAHASSHGVDVRTGETLWSGDHLACPCLGAGAVLLTSGSTAVPAGLTAIDVRSGLPVWQLAFAPATHLVDLVSDGVVVVGSSRVAFYRW